jgi:hypothetical protein
MGTGNGFVKQFYSIAQNTNPLQPRKPEKSNIAIYGCITTSGSRSHQLLAA